MVLVRQCCWTRPQESCWWDHQEQNLLLHGHFLLMILIRALFVVILFQPILIHNLSIRPWGLSQRRLQIRGCLASDGPDLGHYTLLEHLASPEWQELRLRLDSWGRGKTWETLRHWVNLAEVHEGQAFDWWAFIGLKFLARTVIYVAIDRSIYLSFYLSIYLIYSSPV